MFKYLRMYMKNKPSIMIGSDIEVRDLNKRKKSFMLSVHLKHDIESLTDRDWYVAQRSKAGFDYLIKEGFIPENCEDWKVKLNCIIHNDATGSNMPPITNK